LRHSATGKQFIQIKGLEIRFFGLDAYSRGIYFDGSHLYSEDEGGPTIDMDFYGNVIENVNDDCVETDGVGSNCRIYNNTFKTFLTGVSVFRKPAPSSIKASLSRISTTILREKARISVVLSTA
jgi:hypothetical protein